MNAATTIKQILQVSSDGRFITTSSGQNVQMWDGAR